MSKTGQEMLKLWKALPNKAPTSPAENTKPEVKSPAKTQDDQPHAADPPKAGGKPGAAGKPAVRGDSKIMKLQESIKAAGYDPGPIDGKMGPKTRAAVKKFQQANGLAVDGTAGPKTQTALKSAKPVAAGAASSGDSESPASPNSAASSQSAGESEPALAGKSTSALQSIWVEPAGPTLITGKQRQLVAKGDYADGDQHDLTNELEWSSADSQIVSVRKGLLVAGAKCGKTSVTALDRESGVRAKIDVTVAPVGAAVLESLTISPRIKSIMRGEKQQFRATGKYSDGRTEDLTDKVEWWCGWPEGMSIERGLATAGSHGPESESKPEPMWIMAGEMNNDVTDILDFVMTKAPPGKGGPTKSAGDHDFESISVSPNQYRVASGEKIQYKATATVAGGATMDVTRFVYWTSSAPSVVSINRLGGAVVHGDSGSATITATDESSGVSGHVTVTVSG